MTPEIREALKYCPNLPSPPGIAIRIVELGRDPNVDLTALSRLLARDPALASRVLRASNSALYAQRRRSDNLRQALVVIGLNATMTLALSFSLAETLTDQPNKRNVTNLVWRRALISATAARLLGTRVRLNDLEELFLAGLLQDLGILALDAAMPEKYHPLVTQARDHDDLLRREREALDSDHGEAGEWLMNNWGLPKRLSQVASAVHDPDHANLAAPDALFVNCIAVAGKIADLFLGDDRKAGTDRVADDALRLLGIDHDTLDALLNEVAQVLPEVAALYDTEIISPRKAAGVIDQAREILAARNLYLIQEVAEQTRKVQEMERTTQHLRESASRDALTGLLNRGRFDEVLETEFLMATESGWPLTIGFIDLDHFKSVNDTYGHQVGDAVLSRVANILSQQLRERDFIMRYGGEEFVALLPGTGLEQARGVFERLRKAVAKEVHQGEAGDRFHSTVSIGLAAHMDGNRRAASAVDLVRAADRALYEAKRAGRNRIQLDETIKA